MRTLWSKIAAHPVVYFVLLIFLLPCLTYGPASFLSDAAHAVTDLIHFEDPLRSLVSRVRADMRSVATALESYYIDNGTYPAELPLHSLPMNASQLTRLGGENLNTVEPGRPDIGLLGMTTPLAYHSSIPTDNFTGERRPRFYYRGKLFASSHDKKPLPFAYHADGPGWILFSPGPDLIYDIDPKVDYDVRINQPSITLILKSYDATNGSISGGDIFRVKQ